MFDFSARSDFSTMSKNKVSGDDIWRNNVEKIVCILEEVDANN